MSSGCSRGALRPGLIAASEADCRTRRGHGRVDTEPLAPLHQIIGAEAPSGMLAEARPMETNGGCSILTMAFWLLTARSRGADCPVSSAIREHGSPRRENT
jgi:hypothetical protein